jgi:uncharacterized protein
LLPRKLLSSSATLEGDELFPRYLGERDHGWLRELVERYRACIGRPRRELRLELGKPLALQAPRNKRRIAAHVLESLSRDEQLAGAPPPSLRRALFSAAAARGRVRAELVAETAAALGMDAAALERGLFADLASERLLADPGRTLLPSDLAEEANFAIASGLIRRASRLTIEARGETRALVRQAHVDGLICSVSELAADAVRLEISGPFALFRHTHVYGRALASLLPRLTWCSRFELRAECPLRGSTVKVSFRVESGDPIGVARALEAYSGRLEARFARDFSRATREWELVAEPAPLRAGERLISGDFLIVHRRDPARRFLLEIVGYWTVEHLRRKLAEQGEPGAPRLILCIDESKACGTGALPEGLGLVRFRRHIDVQQVLAFVEQNLV